jgi:hypothetical protein
MHDRFVYQVHVKPNAEGIPVYGRLIDVDDPTDIDGPIDQELANAQSDNRLQLPAGIGTRYTQQEDGETAVAMFAVQLPNGFPGDDWRGVFAERPEHLDRVKALWSMDANAAEVDGRVFYDQDDDGIYSIIPPTGDRVIWDPLIIEGNVFMCGARVTVWRRVYVELDSMGPSPGNMGQFPDDPYPTEEDPLQTRDIPMPDIALLNTAFAAASVEFVEIQDEDISVDDVPFTHYLGPDAAAAGVAAAALRQAPGEVGYLTRHIVGVYEVWEAEPNFDNDPVDTEIATSAWTFLNEGGSVAIANEVIRDIANQPGRPQWTPEQITAFKRMLVVHEIGHTFLGGDQAHHPGFPYDVMAVPTTDGQEGVAHRQLPLFLEEQIEFIRKKYGGW